MLKIGHRGAAGYEPENTIRSFKRALELGADSVEFDVRMTKDGQLVVCHDETLDRLAGVAGLLRDKTLAEVKQLNFGKGERIPTVREALEFLKGRARIVMELKERNYTPQLLHLFHDFAPWREEELIVIAFDRNDSDEGAKSSWKDLSLLKTMFPDLEIGLLLTPRKWFFGHTAESICRAASEMRARFIGPHYKMVTPGWINLVHQYDLKMITWAVNEPKDIQRLKDRGIDGIASDFPDRLN